MIHDRYQNCKICLNLKNKHWCQWYAGMYFILINLTLHACVNSTDSHCTECHRVTYS